MDRTLELLQLLNAVLAVITIVGLMATAWRRDKWPITVWCAVLAGVGLDSFLRWWWGHDGTAGTVLITVAFVATYTIGFARIDGE